MYSSIKALRKSYQFLVLSQHSLLVFKSILYPRRYMAVIRSFINVPFSMASHFGATHGALEYWNFGRSGTGGTGPDALIRDVLSVLMCPEFFFRFLAQPDPRWYQRYNISKMLNWFHQIRSQVKTDYYSFIFWERKIQICFKIFEISTNKLFFWRWYFLRNCFSCNIYLRLKKNEASIEMIWHPLSILA